MRRANTRVNVSDKINYVQNGDFEGINLNGWKIEGDPCVSAIQKAGDALGQGAMHYWSDKKFAFTASQTLKNLPDGKYTLRVSTQGGGGQSKYELFCEVNGKRQTAGIRPLVSRTRSGTSGTPWKSRTSRSKVARPPSASPCRRNPAPGARWIISSSSSSKSFHISQKPSGHDSRGLLLRQ